METNEQYEMRSLREAQAHEAEINRAPLSDRKEAQESFAEALRDPALVAERIGWLIDGNYGYGEMLMAKRVVRNKRTNREAALTQMVAIFEWQCPARMAVDAWKKLSASEKRTLDDAVKIVIGEAEKEMKEQG